MKVANFLKESGWELEINNNEISVDLLSEKIRNRISNVPYELKELMSSVNILENSDATAWFITNQDLLEKNEEDPFAWNEFEKQSLEASIDEKSKEPIIQFWESHFCFLMSVKTGYSHISIVTKGNEKGKIVFGFEPEYEEVNVLANDFEEFCQIMIDHINDSKFNEYLEQIL